MIYNKKCQICGQCKNPTDWAEPLNCLTDRKISN